MAVTAAHRPLRVFMALPGKSLFARLGRRRVHVYPAGDPGPLEPDLVVVICSQVSKFDPEAVVLPQEVQARLAAGKARVVFDASLEGRPHDPGRSRAMHGLLERLGAGARPAAYVTQDRGYARDYAAWRRTEDAGRPMAVLTYDYWIKRFFAGVEPEGERLFEARLDAFGRRPASRGRRFVSLNLTLRPTKALFLLSLLRDGLWDQGHISFGGFGLLESRLGRSLPQVAKSLRREPGFESLAAELTPLLGRLDGFGQTLLGGVRIDASEDGDAPALTGDAALGELEDSWFTVVTESEMLDRPCRITEKPFKALVGFHPAILLGNPGALALIRELGFASFPGLFDEAYDEEADPRRRFDRVYQEVVRLCRMDEQELARRVDAMSETLIHNARWGLTRLPALFRERIDAALMDELVRALELVPA